MTEGGGEWDKPPANESNPWADAYRPRACRLHEQGLDVDGRVCAGLKASGVDTLLLIGDSLAFNFEVDLRTLVFGETSPGLNRFDCWVGRRTYFTERGVCHDGGACGGALQVSFMLGAKLSDEGNAKGNLLGYIDALAAARRRVAAVLWLGAHYLADRVPAETLREELGLVLRFLRAREAAFPRVFVLGPTAVFVGPDGTTPWRIPIAQPANYSEVMRRTCAEVEAERAPGSNFTAPFLDVRALSEGAGASHLPDRVHPDEQLNAYIISMVLQLLIGAD